MKIKNIIKLALVGSLTFVSVACGDSASYNGIEAKKTTLQELVQRRMRSDSTLDGAYVSFYAVTQQFEFPRALCDALPLCEGPMDPVEINDYNPLAGKECGTYPHLRFANAVIQVQDNMEVLLEEEGSSVACEYHYAGPVSGTVEVNLAYSTCLDEVYPSLKIKLDEETMNRLKASRICDQLPD